MALRPRYSALFDRLIPTLFLFPSSGFGAAARFKISNFHEVTIRLGSPTILLSRKNLAWQDPPRDWSCEQRSRQDALDYHEDH